jgi:hypothetical protein
MSPKDQCSKGPAAFPGAEGSREEPSQLLKSMTPMCEGAIKEASESDLRAGIVGIIKWTLWIEGEFQ